MSYWRPAYWPRMARPSRKEAGMKDTPLMAELREAMAEACEREGCTSAARTVRQGSYGNVATWLVRIAFAALDVVAKYEAMAVDECRSGRTHWARFPDDAGYGEDAWKVGEPVIYRRKPDEPECVTVPREDLALLIELAEDTPDADEAKSAAARNRDKLR